MRIQVLLPIILAVLIPQGASAQQAPTLQGDGLERRINVGSGQVKDSLFLSGRQAGLSYDVIMQMFQIFGREGDLALDIRPGDHFAVVYEELYQHGVKIKDGDVLAAQITTHGKLRDAVRYIDKEGQAEYYTRAGNTIRAPFLRSPVESARISSHFNPKRKHPVLNKIRPHRGVDYAAPHGTLVKVSGKGKVVFVGTKRGYGKTIVVRHQSQRTTLYAHLSGFSKGIKRGQTVQRGQVIGYVGQTGVASGPHLHYEFRVNGIAQNPVTMELPQTAALPAGYLPNFKAETAQLLAKLDSNTPAEMLAHRKPSKPDLVALVTASN